MLRSTEQYKETLCLLFNIHQQDTINVVDSKKIPVDKIRHENKDSDERCEKIYISYLTTCHYFH